MAQMSESRRVIKNTFVEFISSEEDAGTNATRGLRRTSSWPSMCSLCTAAGIDADAADARSEGSSARHESWADLTDDADEWDGARCASPVGRAPHLQFGLPFAQCGWAPKAEEKSPAAALARTPASGGGRTPLTSKASAFVPLASKQDLSSKASAFVPGFGAPLVAQLQAAGSPEKASAPGIPRMPAPAPPGSWTTVAMGNLPLALSRDALIEVVNQKGFAGCYSFVHMQRDFQSKLGHAIVNCNTEEQATHFMDAFQGFRDWPVSSSMQCSVTWAQTQGLTANIDRYRNDSLIGDNAFDGLNPAIFVGRQRVPMPEPAEACRTGGTMRRWG